MTAPSLALLLAVLAAPALADGPSPSLDPCRPTPDLAADAMRVDAFLSPEAAERMAAEWQAWAEGRCGLRATSPFWAGLTDAERIAAAWGHQPEAPPAPVPLPGALGLLLLGLAALAARRIA